MEINKESSSKKVVVGLSGGVDSSVAALLLKQQGHQVIGVFMKNWDESKDIGGAEVCTAEADYQDVVRVAEKLDIPYYTVDFSPEYWQNVFLPAIEEFKRGVTPNPDVLCNREIKFKIFYEKARALGADLVATGHYCRTSADGQGELLKGIDPGKDQSYFLYMVKAEILKNVSFPIGHLPKAEVRAIAEKHGLITHNKKDSTGICFIGERPFADFLGQYIEEQKGPFKTLKGEIVGEHRGAVFYTLGQRKGLGLGGAGEPWFVVGKDVDKNIVYVERGEHPALYSTQLMANDITWVNNNPCSASRIKKAKVRYRQQDQECQIVSYNEKQDQIQVKFVEPQRAMTPGQSVVFYDGDTCLGGAIIRAVF